VRAGSLILTVENKYRCGPKIMANCALIHVIMLATSDEN